MFLRPLHVCIVILLFVVVIGLASSKDDHADNKDVQEEAETILSRTVRGARRNGRRNGARRNGARRNGARNGVNRGGPGRGGGDSGSDSSKNDVGGRGGAGRPVAGGRRRMPPLWRPWGNRRNGRPSHKKSDGKSNYTETPVPTTPSTTTSSTTPSTTTSTTTSSTTPSTTTSTTTSSTTPSTTSTTTSSTTPSTTTSTTTSSTTTTSTTLSSTTTTAPTTKVPSTEAPPYGVVSDCILPSTEAEWNCPVFITSGMNPYHQHSNCLYYCQCGASQLPAIQTCPDGTVWSQDMNICDTGAYTACQTERISDCPLPTGQTDWNCPAFLTDDVYYAAALPDSRFYCQCGMDRPAPHIIQCSAGTVWKQTAGQTFGGCVHDQEY